MNGIHKPSRVNGVHPDEDGGSGLADSVARAQECLAAATERAWSLMKDDGHWNGELRSNATITAEHVFFYQSLGVPMPGGPAYRDYLLSEQRGDGSPTWR
ncbi:hypothetical protein CDD83_4546 [Cordyceps sp. RAO-2017]|nr:hypothetical protein CDD83_4546 [Cordyceps sp. RAO-2017]